MQAKSVSGRTLVGIIPGAQGGSSEEQAFKFCSDPGLRRVGFQACRQKQVRVWTLHHWLTNAIRICKEPKNEVTNQNSAEFRQNLDELRKNLDIIQTEV